MLITDPLGISHAYVLKKNILDAIVDVMAADSLDLCVQSNGMYNFFYCCNI